MTHLFFYWSQIWEKLNRERWLWGTALHAGVNAMASSFGRSFPRVTRDEPSQIVSRDNEDNKAVMR